LATSRLSSNSPDLLDVAAVMAAFEQINTCRITLHGRVEDQDTDPHLVLIVSALEDLQDLPDPKYLASVNATCHAGSHKTIEGAILWALYQLDWRIAEETMRKAKETA